VTRRAWGAFAALTALLSGCAESNVDERSFTVRELPGVDSGEAYEAAVRALRRDFSRMTASATDGRIITEPTPYTTTTDSGTSRDLVGARSSMRHHATCSVGKRGNGSIVRLRIDVERLDTDRRARSGAADNRLSDSPGYTPIQEDAATTHSQNQVWTYAKRDYRLERALLDELAEHFEKQRGGEPPAPASAPALDRPARSPD
jgi:hypothetical protein